VEEQKSRQAKYGSKSGGSGGVVIRPRAPSDETDRAKRPGLPPPVSSVPPPASAKPLVNLFDDDIPAATTTTSPFLPPMGGGGGSLFDAFPPSSGGYPGGGSGGFPGGGSGGFAPFAGAPMTTHPPQQPSHEEDWDGFKSFETPRDQKDIWYQHKGLFNLQHLNQADPKAAPAKPEEKRALGAMLAEKQKTKPGPALGPASTTFAPFGPTTTTPVPKPGPPIISSVPIGQPVYPTQPIGAYGAVPVVMPPVYQAGYPYGPVYGVATPGMQYPVAGAGAAYPIVPTGYKASAGAK